MSAGRRTAAAFLVAAAVLGLAACAPDPEIASAAAEDAFADVVDAVSALDVTVVRTLETQEPTTAACGDQPDEEQEVRLATATLSIQADDTDAVQVSDAVADRLDGDAWQAIGTDPSLEQEAWTDENGVIVSVTAENSVIVVAVFTPCRS